MSIHNNQFWIKPTTIELEGNKRVLTGYDLIMVIYKKPFPLRKPYLVSTYSFGHHKMEHYPLTSSIRDVEGNYHKCRYDLIKAIRNICIDYHPSFDVYYKEGSTAEIWNMPLYIADCFYDNDDDDKLTDIMCEEQMEENFQKVIEHLNRGGLYGTYIFV